MYLDTCSLTFLEYDKAISLHGEFAEVYNSRGETNQQLGNYKKAIEDYSKALKINNNLSYIKGKILFAKMHINEWDNFDLQISQLIEEIDDKKKTIIPFPLLSLIDDPKMHKDVAENYSRDNFPFFSNKKQITPELKDKINSEDKNENFEKNIQKLTDSSIENIDKILANKEKEILQI